MSKYLLNAFSLQMIEHIAPCNISIREVFNPDLSELKSCVGHIDTANMLGVDYNRCNVTLNKGDFAIVAQVVGGRLPEGCTKLPDGVSFKYYQVDILEDKYDFNDNISEKDLNRWYESLDFATLEKITKLKQFNYNPEDGYQEFVDKCDEYWYSLSYNDKLLYYNNLIDEFYE